LLDSGAVVEHVLDILMAVGRFVDNVLGFAAVLSAV